MLSQRANSERLDKMHDLAMIEDMATRYGYTHEEVMLLGHDFAYNLLYLSKERREHEERFQIESKKYNKNKK